MEQGYIGRLKLSINWQLYPEDFFPLQHKYLSWAFFLNYSRLEVCQIFSGFVKLFGIHVYYSSTENSSKSHFFHHVAGNIERGER